MKRCWILLVTGFIALSTLSCGPTEQNIPTETGEPHTLQLATGNEIDVKIFVGGVPLQSMHGSYTASVYPDPSRTDYGGNTDHKIITRTPTLDGSQVLPCSTPPQGQCTNIRYFDLYHVDNIPAQWGGLANGVYVLSIDRPNTTQNCYFEVVQNHVSLNADGFFDTMFIDQILTINFPSGPGCGSSSWNIQHQKSSSPLTVTFPGAPTSVVAGQSFTITANASQGFGNYRYVKNSNAVSYNQVDFVGQSFSQTKSWTLSYPNPGTYLFAVAARDSGSTGGNYSLGVWTIQVTQPGGVDNAESLGTDLAFWPWMCPSEIRYVTFTMKNIGTTTWIPNTYRLDLHHDGGWLPTNIPLTNSVSPGQTKEFSFYLQAPSQEATYGCYYSMFRTTYFGQQNGTQVNVSSSQCFGGISLASTASASTLLEDPSDSWNLLSRATTVLPLRLYAMGNSPVSTLDLTYASGETRAVDVILRIAYDPELLEPKVPHPGSAGSNLNYKSGVRRPGEYWIRVHGSLVPGHGLISRIPFVRKREIVEGEGFGTVTFFQ